MAVGVVLALSAIVARPALVPVLPVRSYPAPLYPLIDDDQPETIGWPELVATVRRTVAALAPDQRHGAVVFTGNDGPSSGTASLLASRGRRSGPDWPIPRPE